GLTPPPQPSAPAQSPPASSSGKWFRDPGVSRSLFAPTGFTLEHGERLLKVEAIYVAFELGIADHLSVELGTVYPGWLVGAINGEAGVKWGTDLNEQWHVAVSALAGGFPWSFTLGSGAMGLGTVTYGSRDANVTCSAGAVMMGLASSKASPVGEAALYYRLTQNLALETEHWFSYLRGPDPSFLMIHAGGVRLMFESVAIHAGAMSISTMATSAPGATLSVWPWVGLTWLTTS
ncbi:MAG TPA: hypothetical protein VIG99_31750, partial [Myxococcaceae bacterium]